VGAAPGDHEEVRVRKSSKFVSLVALCTLVAAGAAGTARAGILSKPVTGTSRVNVVTAGRSWAPAATAAIHPGVQTFTQGAQCTANFVFDDGKNVYIGQGAHCAGTGGNTETNGCTAKVLPEGTRVQVGGASKPGVMVYNSWVRMQTPRAETDANACQGNDFALIRLDPADFAKVNPSVPFWGGPTSVDGGGTTVGELVYTYGNSELRAGISALSPKFGVSLGDNSDGWLHDVYTVTPGVPGDSGSAVLGSTGGAIGVLRTINTVPPAANGIGDLAHQLAYMASHSSFGAAHMVPGTQAFSRLV
jgi:hypothetical protein